MLSTLDSAKEPNLAYEEAEDSEVEDDMGEGEKFGVFEGERNAEFEAFCSLGEKISREAMRIWDDIGASLDALYEEGLEESIQRSGRLTADKDACLRLSVAWDRKYKEKEYEDEDGDLADKKRSKDMVDKIHENGL